MTSHNDLLCWDHTCIKISNYKVLYIKSFAINVEFPSVSVFFNLQVAYETADTFKSKFDKKLQDDLVPLLAQPLQVLDKKTKSKCTISTQLSDKVTTSISDYLRSNVADVDSGPLQQVM